MLRYTDAGFFSCDFYIDFYCQGDVHHLSAVFHHPCSDCRAQWDQRGCVDWHLSWVLHWEWESREAGFRADCETWWTQSNVCKVCAEKWLIAHWLNCRQHQQLLCCLTTYRYSSASSVFVSCCGVYVVHSITSLHTLCTEFVPNLKELS